MLSPLRVLLQVFEVDKALLQQHALPLLATYKYSEPYMLRALRMDEHLPFPGATSDSEMLLSEPAVSFRLRVVSNRAVSGIRVPAKAQHEARTSQHALLVCVVDGRRRTVVCRSRPAWQPCGERSLPSMTLAERACGTPHLSSATSADVVISVLSSLCFICSPTMRRGAARHEATAAAAAPLGAQAGRHPEAGAHGRPLAPGDASTQACLVLLSHMS